jgi:hypothetical protein
LDGRERLQTEMEIESFHVRTIKMFFVELQVVGMTTRRPLAINLLWRLANGTKKNLIALQKHSRNAQQRGDERDKLTLIYVQ